MANERDSEIEAQIAALLKDEQTRADALAPARGYEQTLRGLVARELRSIPASQRGPLIDEVYADLWVQAAASLNQFQGKSMFKTWLGTIAIRTAWRAARKARTELGRTRSMSAEEENALPAPSDSVASWMSSSKVRRLAPALDPWMKSVLSSLEREKSWESVAASRGTSVHACKSRWFRGIRKLRVLFLGAES